MRGRARVLRRRIGGGVSEGAAVVQKGSSGACFLGRFGGCEGIEDVFSSLTGQYEMWCEANWRRRA